MKIIIAEDDEDIALSYRIALESRRHEVTVTKDGAQFMIYYAAICNTNPDQNRVDAGKLEPPFNVAILDYRMPEKNGLEVAKEILELRPNQRIIFASAFVREALIDPVMQSKMVVDILQKPFELAELVETVERVVMKC